MCITVVLVLAMFTFYILCYSTTGHSLVMGQLCWNMQEIDHRQGYLPVTQNVFDWFLICVI